MLTIDLIVEWACLVVGLLCFRQRTPRSAIAVLAVVAITVVNEAWVAHHVYIPHRFNRNTSYNVFTLLEMGGWFYFFFLLLPKARRWLLPAALVVYAYSFVELCFIKDWLTLHTDSYRVYELVIMTASCTYLLALARKDYHRSSADPFFWLCAAALVYHAITFLNLTTMSEATYWIFRDARPVFYLLQGIGNILYYLMISVAFVICYRFRQTCGTASFQS